MPWRLIAAQQVPWEWQCADPQGEGPCWVVCLQGLGHRGAAPRCLSWGDKKMKLCAVVRMILCVCFLQVHLYERRDPGALRSAGLEALWWVCKLDRVWIIWRTPCGRCLHPLELPCLPLWHLTPLVKPVVQVLSTCPTGARWKPLIWRKCNHLVLKLSAFWNNIHLNCIWL